MLDLKHNYEISSFKVIGHITSILDECSIYLEDFFLF